MSYSDMTYAGTMYRLVDPDDRSRVPEPIPEPRGIWQQPPNGQARHTVPAGVGVTRWQPNIEVENAAAYSAFAAKAKAEAFGTLNTPWGTKNAVIKGLALAQQPSGKFRGSISWEWA